MTPWDTQALVQGRVAATSSPILTRLGFTTYGIGRTYSLPLGAAGCRVTVPRDRAA